MKKEQVEEKKVVISARELLIYIWGALNAMRNSGDIDAALDDLAKKVENALKDADL